MSISVPREDMERLSELAERKGQGVSEYVRGVLHRHVTKAG